MDKSRKTTVAVILASIFVFINVIHIYWPIHLILEDIQKGTMVGTGIELGALIPWMIEVISIPFVLSEIGYFIYFRKVKYFNLFNAISFGFYVLQVIIFNVLLNI